MSTEQDPISQATDPDTSFPCPHCDATINDDTHWIAHIGTKECGVYDDERNS